MSDPDRLTAAVVVMHDAVTNPPPNGMRVHALNIGGVMCQTTWNSESHKFFEAWHPYLKVPQSVKSRMSSRYKQLELI